MKRLVYAPERGPRYQGDVDRIVRACAAAGYAISRTDAEMVWEAHSNDYAASWLVLPEDDADLVVSVRCYCREED